MKDIWLIRIGLDFLLPSLIILSGFFGEDMDQLWCVHIRINNVLILSAGTSHLPDNIVMLLPRCLQYENCSEKVTQDIMNCRGCGKCVIGSLRKMVSAYGIPTFVVSGGSAARSIVRDKKPELVLAVACERELASGVMDLGRLPVVCMINQRPNGPCSNTTVNLREVEERIMDVIGKNPSTVSVPILVPEKKV